MILRAASCQAERETKWRAWVCCGCAITCAEALRSSSGSGSGSSCGGSGGGGEESRPSRCLSRTLLSPISTASTPAASLQEGTANQHHPLGAARACLQRRAAEALAPLRPVPATRPSPPRPPPKPAPALHHPQVVVLGGRLCLVADGQGVGNHKDGALWQHHVAGPHLRQADVPVGGGGAVESEPGKRGPTPAAAGYRAHRRCPRLLPRPPLGWPPLLPLLLAEPHRIEVDQLGNAWHAHDGDCLVHAACRAGQAAGGGERRRVRARLAACCTPRVMRAAALPACHGSLLHAPRLVHPSPDVTPT